MLNILLDECNNCNFFDKLYYEQEIERYFEIIRSKKYYNEDVFDDIKRVRQLKKIYYNNTGKFYKPIKIIID